MSYIRIIYPNSGSGGSVSEHNNLLGLQGTGTDYIHLNTPEYNYVRNIIDNDLIDLILDAISISPNYIQPISSITNITNTYEVGSTQFININQMFTQNDAGNKVSETITKNNSIVRTTSNFNESLVIPNGIVTYGGTVTYQQGPCNRTNNLGVIDCTNRISAGTINSAPRIITGAFRRFAGSVVNFPITGSQLRNDLISSSALITNNNFTFQTGTINRKFIIALPSNKNLISVQNTGTNEFLTFILSNTITTVPDGGNTNQNYKVYTLETAVPFSSNYTLNVIIS